MSGVSLDTFVTVTTRARCPVCSKEVTDARKISAAEVQEGTVDVVRHSIAALEDRVKTEITTRGWSDAMCGKCRDK